MTRDVTGACSGWCVSLCASGVRCVCGTRVVYGVCDEDMCDVQCVCLCVVCVVYGVCGEDMCVGYSVCVFVYVMCVVRV